MLTINYPIPTKGLGTDFAASERPLTYAQSLVNRFINITGAAERRAGMMDYVSGAVITGQPTLTRIHEFIDPTTGSATLMASTDTGTIYAATASGWGTILTGKASARMLSVEVDGKLIFANSLDRDFYTDNAGQSFVELQALINEGTTGGSTDTTHLQDTQISDWLTQTNVAVNDLVFNETVSAYGIITNGTAAGLVHTNIGVSGKGAGSAGTNQASGQVYRVLDMVASNIIPVGSSFDNVAVAGSGTTATKIAVSGVNFANTTIATGDPVYNTTRAAVSLVRSVSANITLTSGIVSAAAGDSLVFLKSALPFTSYLHVSWGRTYYLNARLKTQVVISSKDDPRDLSTFAKTLEASSYDFASQQPAGDILLAMATFQRYFVAGGKRYVYAFAGVDPIADTSGSVVSFSPVGVYPQGIVSRFGLTNTGNDLLFVSQDGLINATVSFDSQNLVSSNVSDVIKSVLRQAILSTPNPDDIQLTFYPRRNWIILKVGLTCYIYNATPVILGGEQQTGTWSTFTGTWATQINHYFVRQNGDLIGAGNRGRVYKMDTGFTDVGDTIATEIVTAWLRLEEPEKSVRVKDGKYVKPTFESGGGVVYTIRAKAGFDNLSEDEVSVVAVGGSEIGTFTVGNSQINGTGVDTQKLPLRWRGEQVQLTITSNSSAGPDVITGITVYGNQYGRR